jgi:hypothetical protein
MHFVMASNYARALKEFDRISKTASGDNRLDVSVEILREVRSNEILKDAIFVLSFFKTKDRGKFEKYEVKFVRGQEIMDALKEYDKDGYDFDYKLAQGN